MLRSKLLLWYTKYELLISGLEMNFVFSLLGFWIIFFFSNCSIFFGFLTWLVLFTGLMFWFLRIRTQQEWLGINYWRRLLKVLDLGRICYIITRKIRYGHRLYLIFQMLKVVIYTHGFLPQLSEKVHVLYVVLVDVLDQIWFNDPVYHDMGVLYSSFELTLQLLVHQKFLVVDLILLDQKLLLILVSR